MTAIHIGSVEVLPLLDAVLPNPATEVGRDLAEHSGLDGPDGMLDLPVTCYLVRSRGQTVLVDTGIGPRRRGSWPRGRLHVALAAAGLMPADVDVVVNTHFHADHVGWNTIDDENGCPVPMFTEARHLFVAEEWAHWSRPTEVSRPGNIHLRECVVPLVHATDVRIVPGTAAITPEVTLEPLPGHTPGHVGVTIVSGGERAMIIGDVSHFLAQVAHPEWSTTWDHDRHMATATRVRLFDAVEQTDALVAGGHWPFPGVGRLIRLDDRRVFAAVNPSSQPASGATSRTA